MLGLKVGFSRKHGGRELLPEKRCQGDGSNAGNNDGNKVSFYVTNFPGYMPLFRLRQFFEVCGMLFDVYVARTRMLVDSFLGLYSL